MSTVRAKSGIFRVVEPVVIGEPAVGGRHGHELPGPLMVEPVVGQGLPVEHLGDAVGRLEHGPHLGDPGRVSYVDVGHLVIGHGEGLALARIEQFPAEIDLLHRHQARPPQQPG